MNGMNTEKCFFFIFFDQVPQFPTLNTARTDNCIVSDDLLPLILCHSHKVLHLNLQEHQHVLLTYHHLHTINGVKDDMIRSYGHFQCFISSFWYM